MQWMIESYGGLGEMKLGIERREIYWPQEHRIEVLLQ